MPIQIDSLISAQQLDSENWGAIKVMGLAQQVSGRIVGCYLMPGNYLIPDNAPVTLQWGTSIYISGFTYSNGDVAATLHCHWDLIDPDGIVRLSGDSTRQMQPNTAYGMPNSNTVVLDKPITPVWGTWYIVAILEAV